jgi:hypothetical protein
MMASLISTILDWLISGKLDFLVLRSKIQLQHSERRNRYRIFPRRHPVGPSTRAMFTQTYQGIPRPTRDSESLSVLIITVVVIAKWGKSHRDKREAARNAAALFFFEFSRSSGCLAWLPSCLRTIRKSTLLDFLHR